jgi:threonine dehydratase
MPDTAPLNRTELIQSYGVQVERLPSASLMDGIRRHEQNHGAIFLHPFDDRHLIAGYGSLGCEILEDVPDVDIVVVCCGGGGLLAGTATALAYFGKNVRVFGVEPENACGMYKSLKVNQLRNDHFNFRL